MIGLVAVVVLFVAIQLVPKRVSDPTVKAEPPWDSPVPRWLAVAACFNCHSNSSHVALVRTCRPRWARPSAYGRVAGRAELIPADATPAATWIGIDAAEERVRAWPASRANLRASLSSQWLVSAQGRRNYSGSDRWIR
jgi:hypothetical protein